MTTAIKKFHSLCPPKTSLLVLVVFYDVGAWERYKDEPITSATLVRINPSIPKRTIEDCIDTLVKLELVRKEVNDKDKRARDISLTAKGREQYNNLPK